MIEVIAAFMIGMFFGSFLFAWNLRRAGYRMIWVKGHPYVFRITPARKVDS